MEKHKEVANGVKIKEITKQSDKGENCCAEFCKCLFGLYNLIFLVRTFAYAVYNFILK